jgi:multiple sugar transport system ATP-binding protein
VLSAGRLEQVGGPDEIYDRPTSRFVATFVGSPPMNVCDGEYVDGALVGPGLRVGAPAGATAVGVRPEHLLLGAAAEAAAEAGPAAGPTIEADLTLTGQVVTSERLGAERTLYVETGAGIVTVRVDATVPVGEGEAVTLVAAARTLSFFDAAGRVVALGEVSAG